MFWEWKTQPGNNVVLDKVALVWLSMMTTVHSIEGFLAARYNSGAVLLQYDASMTGWTALICVRDGTLMFSVMIADVGWLYM